MNEAIATVVIVNWNGAHLLPACLGALARQELPGGDTFATIVVDNASTDGSLELLAERFPGVTVIADDANRGFAGGNNTALRHVETPFAVLLNNDATPQPGWLANLLAPFHQAGGDRIGMTTGKVVFEPRFAEISISTAGFTPGAHDDRDLGVRIHQVLVNGENVIGDVLWERLTYGREGDGFFWTRPAGTMLVPVPATGEVTLGFAWAAETDKPVTLSSTEETLTLTVPAHDPAVVSFTLPATTPRVDVINNVGGVVLKSGHGADRGYQQVDRGQFDEPADVFLGCGNGMALRTAVGHQLDWFDDDFFLYYEDSDLSWRLRSLGWTIRYVPSAVLRHRHAASSGEWSPLFVFHTERNRLLNLTKNAQAGLALTEVPRFALTTASMTVRAVRQLLATRSRPAIRPLILRGRVLQSYLKLLPAMLRKRGAIRVAARVGRPELETLLVTADEWRSEGVPA